jgi:GT2 family glycosyltransferase
MRHWDYGSRAEVEVLSGCFWLARRKAVEEVGGLDERFFFYAEDMDWCRRFKDAGWKVVFVPEATATHFGGGSSANVPLRYSIEMLRGGLLYWKKYHGRCGCAVYYCLATMRHFLRLIANSFLQLLRVGNSEETQMKLDEDFVCLRWLLTRKSP